LAITNFLAEEAATAWPWPRPEWRARRAVPPAPDVEVILTPPCVCY
jgi:hypothetical protein